jgi:putative tricarboxylic transport membrane protein
MQPNRLTKVLARGIPVLIAAFTAPLAAQDAPAQAGRWDVTEARGEVRTIDFTTNEGTEISVDPSPDGSWLVFDLLAHIYRMPAAGGTAEVLTQNSGVALNYHPRISPDGRQIAFVSDRDGQPNLWIMNADGRGQRRLLAARPRSVLGASTVRGLTSLFLGLLLGLVGIDSQTGAARFAFGIPELLDGIDVVVLAVGLFAVGEALYVAAYQSRLTATMEKLSGSVWMSLQDWKRSWPAWLRATAIGFPFGTIPAGGSEIPTFLSYATEKKLTRYRHEFGKGAIEGVAGPEAANNASATGVLVPLLTLGIPTSATAAILLGAFQNYGLQPGPLLFQSQTELVWGLIASLYVGNVMLLILNLPLIGIWVRVLTIPKPLLYAGILVFATLGAYSLHQSWVDLVTLYVFGLLGFAMRRWDIPVGPAVIGLILGPLAETQFRRALAISQGDPSVFFTQPISATFLTITAILLVAPWVIRYWKRRRGS